MPILILYKDGSEIQRFPILDKNGNTLQAKKYLKKDLILLFGLEEIYAECCSKIKK